MKRNSAITVIALALIAVCVAVALSEREEEFCSLAVPVKNKQTLAESLESFVAGEMMVI